MRIPSSMSQLGTFLDAQIEKDGVRTRFSLRKYILCTDPSKRVLWLLPKPAKVRRVPLEGHAEAARIRKDWSQLVPSKAFSVPVSTGATKRLGNVAVIAYRDNKWSGKFEDYEHIFRTPPILERSGNVLRIRGPSVRATPRGIVG